MRHAILGAGGVGLLIGGALAQAGQPVLLILRPASLDEYPGGIHVESGVLGEFDVDVPVSGRLDRPIDVLWVTVKATQLEEALLVAAPAVAPDALVVPLLNGVDHVDRLRAVFGDQLARVGFDFGVCRFFGAELSELDLAVVRGANEPEDRWLGPTAASGALERIGTPGRIPDCGGVDASGSAVGRGRILGLTCDEAACRNCGDCDECASSVIHDLFLRGAGR
jgi:hypothetical protein